MDKRVRRISIIGGCGSGKTTIANNLGEKYNLPVCHLDGIEHFANWKKRDKAERDAIILKKIDEDKWIIDGTYHTTLRKRLEKSDLIIFLDYSTQALLKGVLERYFKNHGKEKAEIPGCKEELNFKFLWFVFRWRKNRRKEVLKILKEIKKENILIFKSRKKLNNWYEQTFNCKILV